MTFTPSLGLKKLGTWMKDYHLTGQNIDDFLTVIQDELETHKHLIVKTQDANTGKWGMARLWRSWMATTARFMAASGVTMPLMISAKGKHFGVRDFNADDSHELFTSKWLGVGEGGQRLSWSKSGNKGKRAATKGERYNALRLHEQWCVEHGITILIPRDSEYEQLTEAQNK